MKRIILAIIGVMLLGGCGIFNEAYVLDNEFGVATRASFDNQIAYPDYRYAGVNPEGLEGINAEGAMDVYNKSFAEASSADISAFDNALTGKNE